MNLIQRNNLKITAIILICLAILTVVGIRNSPDSIHNPANSEFVVEVAFNEQIAPEEVTQAMFNERYGTALKTLTLKK